ncbi:retrovirus-related pol polyprotein from transposon TNT 1-94, partial [Tanacetum coccineum]
SSTLCPIAKQNALPFIPGTIHQTSCPNTPQQNERAERKHKHHLEVARSIHFQAKFPIHLWGYCLIVATYLINRLPSKTLNNKSRYELLYHKPPDLQNLKVIGCQAYASIYTSDKFDKRAILSILLGYPQHQKGYLLFAHNTKKVFVSTHVTFHEHIFPFHTNTPYYTSTTTDPEIPTNNFYPEPNTPSNPSTSPEPTPSTSTHTTSSLPPPTSTPSPPTIRDNITSTNDITTEPLTTPEHHYSTTTTPTTTTSTTNTIPSTQPTNTLPSSPTPPPNISSPPSPPPLKKSQRTRTIPTKLKDFHHYHPSTTNSAITKHHTSHFINYNNIQNPTTLYFINLITHETEPTFYTQASKNPKWVEAMNNEISALEIKYNANGSIDKYKARLVAKRFNQQEGIDYTKTFTLVAKMVIVRNLLVVSSVQNWDVQQLDINNVFLHRDLYEDTKQWFIKLTIFLTTLGFSQSHADSSLFTYYKDKDALVLLIYIDDILLADNRIEFLRNSKGLAMTQRKYALDLIEFADPSYYMTLVGKLIYITISRPDIAFAAQLLRQGLFFPRPTIQSYMFIVTMIRLVVHLQGGQYLSSRRPVSGFCIFLGNSLISWHSKKQSVVYRSSTEAEYRALAECSCEITWLCSLLKDLNVTVPNPVKILYDNISTIALASNPI